MTAPLLELVDTLPDVNVQPGEFRRLLGYPRDWVLRDRAKELADWARAWYAENGRPWVYARQASSVEVADGRVTIEGRAFSSERLWRSLKRSGADDVVLVAVSAGPEVADAAQRAWLDEKPDEYFFLEIYGSAVVEHLIAVAGGRLCGWAESHGRAVLPHDSPGYPEWDVAEQNQLLELIRQPGRRPLPGPLETLDSGMLRPKKSLLAVFGVTHDTGRVRKLSELIPCESCSLASCQYRRAPYQRTPKCSMAEFSTPIDAADAPASEPVAPLTLDGKYATNPKALGRWARERLTIEEKPDGSIAAVFRFEGTTCSNMGVPLLFDYGVALSPAEEGFVIREQTCRPAPGDEGYRRMCKFMNNAEHMTVALENEKPLAGRPLDEVLTWSREACSAGCHCHRPGRDHKWGLALETIHYALAERIRSEQPNGHSPTQGKEVLR